MGIVQNLALLALRQTVVGARAEHPGGKDAEGLGGVLAERCAACGQRLADALEGAANLAWMTVEIALDGSAGWDRIQSALTAPEDQSVRNAVRGLLDSPVVADLADAGFRQECCRDLRAARRSGLLDDFLNETALARQAIAAWHAAADAAQLGEAERRVVDPVTAELRGAGHSHLARLLELQGPGGSSLYASAIRAAFRRAVAGDETLRQHLPWAAGESSADPAGSVLAALAEALERGARLGELLASAAATPDGVHPILDLHAERPQLGPVLQRVSEEAAFLLSRHGMERRELRATDCLAVVNPGEQRQIQQLTNRFRATPEEQRKKAPALLTGLAKLEAAAGNYDLAYRAFVTVANHVTDPVAQAETFANVYQVALERRQWPEAVAALRKAMAREPERFAPFPLQYEPEAIVRADAFGVSFLCRHRASAVPVEVRSLRPEVLARSVADVFLECQLVEALGHPAILGLRECDFADAARTRPYLVCDYFDGESLASWVEHHGTMAPADLLPLARQVAEALQQAHNRGVLHRDLRPTNVLIRQDDSGWRVKLVNFGLALRPALLRAGLVAPAAQAQTTLCMAAVRALDYAAPEQLGRQPDTPFGPHSDVYSFGRTFYYGLLHTPEPDDEQKASLPAGWRRVLGLCTAATMARRLSNFDPVVERLNRPPGAPQSDPRLLVSPQSAPAPTRPSAQGVLAPLLAKPPAAPAKPPAPATAPPQPVRSPAAAVPPAPLPGPTSSDDQAAACIQRGVALRTKGDFDKAIAEFSRALLLDPHNPQAYEGRGNAHVNKGDFDRAIADYTHALKIDPTLALVHVNRGLAYAKKKESDRAVADYTAAIEIDPKLPVAYLNRGSAHARHGDYERAILDFNAALQIDNRQSLAYLNRGLAHSKCGRLDQAIADYQLALKLDPNNTQAQARLQEAEQSRGPAAPTPTATRPPTPTATRPPTPTATKPPTPTATKPPTPTLTKPPTPTATKPPTPTLTKPPTPTLTKPPTPTGAAAQGPAPTPTKPAASSGPTRGKRKSAELTQARQLRLLQGHTDAVRAIAFSPEGRQVFSASEDKTICLWDLKTGKPLARYLGHTAGVTCVAVAPGGGARILSGGQDHTVRLWDVEGGQEIRRFGARGIFGGGNAHADAVVSVAFSPDGQRALSASWDKTVRLWEIDSGKELRVYEGHQWLIHSVVFAPDGQHFMYGSEDHTARLCQVDNGQEIRRFEGHTSWVLSVAFSADGRQALTGSADGSMRLWSVARRKEERQLGAQMGLVQSVALSPDGKMALSGEYSPARQETMLVLWDLETGAEVARLPGHQQLIWSVAFSPDGKYALSGSADTTVRLWRMPR